MSVYTFSETVLHGIHLCIPYLFRPDKPWSFDSINHVCDHAIRLKISAYRSLNQTSRHRLLQASMYARFVPHKTESLVLFSNDSRSFWFRNFYPPNFPPIRFSSGSLIRDLLGKTEIFALRFTSNSILAIGPTSPHSHVRDYNFVLAITTWKARQGLAECF